MHSPDWTLLEALTHRDPGGRGLPAFRVGGAPLDAGNLRRAAEDLAARAAAVAIVTGFCVETEAGITSERVSGEGATAVSAVLDAASIAHGSQSRGAQPKPFRVTAETDGPPGALFLARALRQCGVEVALIGDRYATPLLAAGCQHWGLPPECIHEMPLELGAAEAGAWARDFLDGSFGRRLTHLAAIERCGPSHTLASLLAQRRSGTPPVEEFERSVPPHDRDTYHNMRGVSVDAHSAKTHLLFEQAALRRPPIVSIGIGDGGNELGMGSFPWETVVLAVGSALEEGALREGEAPAEPFPGDAKVPDAGRVERVPGSAGASPSQEAARERAAGASPSRTTENSPAPRIVSRIAADLPLLAGVSNWAGYALGLAVCQLRRGEVPAEWNADELRRLLETLVRAGAVDGVTGRREATVDGLPLDVYLPHFAALRAAAAG